MPAPASVGALFFPEWSRSVYCFSVVLGFLVTRLDLVSVGGRLHFTLR